MFRAFKQFVLRCLHKHAWEIIWRGTGSEPNDFTFTLGTPKKKNPIIIERCYCGEERAWILHPNKRVAIDSQWLREVLRTEHGVEVVDR